jgi:glutamine amidotransferase
MIAIIDYGMGNLRSVQKALERVGGRDARLVRTADELAGAEKIVFPGVAAFGDAMDALRGQKLVEPIIAAVRAGTPYLGFCLGLQLLFEVGTEDGEHKGLGLLGGKVVKFEFGPELTALRLRIPHMGWNRIRWTRDCAMLRGIDNGAYVYFAHSYYPVPSDESIIATTTDYGGSFASAVQQGNIFATQFHPEKSQAVGLKLLENFVGL